MTEAKQGVTPRNLLWKRVTNCTIHDADTLTGDIRTGIKKSGFFDQPIRALACDACEVSMTRTNVLKKITAEEIRIGIQARDELRVIAGGNAIEIGYDGAKDMPVDKYGRLLAYVRIRRKDNSILWLAEWLQERGYNRSQLP